MQLDISVKNIADSMKHFSSLLFLSVKDGDNYTWQASLFDDSPSPGGALNAGDTTRGFVAFEVPNLSKDLRLIIGAGFASTDTVFVPLS